DGHLNGGKFGLEGSNRFVGAFGAAGRLLVAGHEAVVLVALAIAFENGGHRGSIIEVNAGWLDDLMANCDEHTRTDGAGAMTFVLMFFDFERPTITGRSGDRSQIDSGVEFGAPPRADHRAVHNDFILALLETWHAEYL